VPEAITQEEKATMATNQGMTSIRQTPTTEGDKQMKANMSANANANGPTTDMKESKMKITPSSLIRGHGRIFGVLFIITFLTSIPPVALYQPVLNDPVGYITGGGQDTQIYLGALLEFFLIVSGVGTAVVLYPIVRRQNEALAIGYVASRIMESVFIAGGIIFVLGVVGLRHDLPSAHDAAFTLAALKNWTFLFGPGFFPLGNGLLLGYLMYRSGLVPRRMAWLGLIGGPLLFIVGVGVLFAWWNAGGTVQSLATIPEAIWELFLGVYCTIWGFRKDSPIVRPNWRGEATA
jgi:hypothetical protein